ncbi:MAG: ribonucleoside triphosphate reductase, partial [Clostridia bacterium]|nr:ribonucleoside triphosphate reductase [Clostridia bacterium]
TLYTSGTVFHTYLGERLADWKAAQKLVRTIAENYRLPYYSLSPIYSVCTDHGYIAGDCPVCPTCGQATEVYSRITGYYRPVKNWNDGKSQEYKERQNYIIETSVLKKKEEVATCCTCEQQPQEVATSQSRLVLFVKNNCPNCKMAEMFFAKKGLAYEEVNAEENVELTKQFGIKTAPTLVVIEGDAVTTYENASNIKKFIESK